MYNVILRFNYQPLEGSRNHNASQAWKKCKEDKYIVFETILKQLEYLLHEEYIICNHQFKFRNNMAP